MCGIGDDGAKALAEAVRCSGSLATLYLKENKIGDVGAKAFAEAVAASVSLKMLAVDRELKMHAELKATCKLKGVRLV